MRRVSVILLAGVLLGGCAGYSPCIKPSDTPNGDSAYVYGRFEQDHNVAGSWNSIQFPAGITLVAVDGKSKEKIRFQKKEHVCGIEVTPGRYCIDKWVWNAGSGSKVVEMSLEDHVRDNKLYFEAGHAYYLGDFLAYGYAGQNPFDTYFVLEIPENNFESTTREFNEKYPLFREVPKSLLFERGFFKDEFNKKHVIHQHKTMIFIPVVGG